MRPPLVTGHRATTVLVAALVTAVLAASTALAQAESTVTASRQAPASIDELLAQFDSNYQHDPSLLDAMWSVQSLSQATAAENLPRFTFTERASWAHYERWSFDLSLTASAPLYRSRAEPLAALHAEQAAQLALEQELAHHEARNRFLNDLLSLSLLRTLEVEVAQAIERLRVAGLSAPTSVEETFEAHPSERELIATYWQALSLQGFLSARVPELELRVSKALGYEVKTVLLPGFGSLMARAVPKAPDIEQCLRTSPLLRQARAHHQVQLLEQGAQQNLDVRVELLGNAHYGVGGLSAAIGVEARLATPSTWPVSGQVTAAAGLDGADQTLRLSWPPPAPAFRPVSAFERTDRHTAEVESLKQELTSLVRSLGSAEAAVQSAEVQLLWSVRDLHELTDLEQARGLATMPAEDPLAELHLVRLRSDLGFARLAHAELLLNVALVCGTRP